MRDEGEGDKGHRMGEEKEESDRGRPWMTIFNQMHVVFARI